MPSYDLEYPKQPFSTVNRYNNRATYSLETIHQIINTTHFLNVSFTDPKSPYPVSLPMIGQVGSFERPSADLGEVLDLYLHGYVSSRFLNLSRDSSIDTEEDKGLPITVSATHVDGLVLALTPNNHSYNYRSATLFGLASLVTDPDEKLYAMELITNGVVPDRWRHSRVPPTKGEMASTGLLRVRIVAGSAKVRSGMPGDEKFDTEDDELTARVWTGIVPVYSTMGDLMPAPGNRVETPPAYLADFVRDGNEGGRETAVEMATKAMKPKGKTED